MLHDLATLKTIKTAAIAQFGQLAGVEGFGIGDDSIRVYVRNDQVRKSLPTQFKGVDLEIIATGTITASNR